MRDTSPEIERLVREKIMARTSEERFVMGAQMFDSACQMILASFPPDLAEGEVRQRLFKRLYQEQSGKKIAFPFLKNHQR